jgi:hypothetical protein
MASDLAPTGHEFAARALHAGASPLCNELTMTKAEFVLLCRYELPKTLKLLRLYPEDKKDLKPSPVIRSAIETLGTFMNNEEANSPLIRAWRGPRCRRFMARRPMCPCSRINSRRKNREAHRNAPRIRKEDRGRISALLRSFCSNSHLYY